jgi:hypothetical protein
MHRTGHTQVTEIENKCPLGDGENVVNLWLREEDKRAASDLNLSQRPLP